ncbi:MAG: hypothetical protein M3P94_02370, partial [Chloroflexota bacterium]|nr:hypothetical protein [Chloroflexota bacterium]
MIDVPAPAIGPPGQAILLLGPGTGGLGPTNGLRRHPAVQANMITRDRTSSTGGASGHRLEPPRPPGPERADPATRSFVAGAGGTSMLAAS